MLTTFSINIFHMSPHNKYSLKCPTVVYAVVHACITVYFLLLCSVGLLGRACDAATLLHDNSFLWTAIKNHQLS